MTGFAVECSLGEFLDRLEVPRMSVLQRIPRLGTEYDYLDVRFAEELELSPKTCLQRGRRSAEVATSEDLTPTSVIDDEVVLHGLVTRPRRLTLLLLAIYPGLLA